jgi:hypothetical protein
MSEPTWGDTVLVSQQAPRRLRPGELAEIVGIRHINSPNQADQFAAPIGTRVYLVEFSDGIALEVPEKWIEVAP